jgi:IS30 family transposase
MKGYQQLTQEKRYQISALRQAQHSRAEIAALMGVHPATVGRELRRNTGQRGYRPKQAQELAQARQQQRARQPRIGASTWTLIETQLRQEWSPEQISGWLAKTHQLQVSHERIYAYVYADQRRGGTL